MKTALKAGITGWFDGHRTSPRIAENTSAARCVRNTALVDAGRSTRF
jgi:hypothetical protein